MFGTMFTNKWQKNMILDSIKHANKMVWQRHVGVIDRYKARRPVWITVHHETENIIFAFTDNIRGQMEDDYE